MPHTSHRGGNGGFRITREEFRAQASGQARILYAHFNRQRTFLGCRHAKQRARIKAQHIAADIVRRNREYHHCRRFQKAVAVYRRHPADNTGKRQHRHPRHGGAHIGKPALLMQQNITHRADHHRQQRHQQHKFKHAPAVHIHRLPYQQHHPQWRHHRREQSRNCGHPHRIRHIALSQKAHDVRRHPARASAHQHQAQSEAGRKIKQLGNADRQQRHNRILHRRTDKNIQRALRQNAIVFLAQSNAHAEHNDAQHQNLRVALYPRKSGRFNHRHHRCKADDHRGKAG